MTIYREITAQNSCALKPNEVYITQREKIKDFHDLAEFTFRRRSRLWKPSTLRVNRDYLKNQILPFFKTHPIASINRDDVATWFAGLSHMPEGANRAVPVLSAIMVEAEELGLRPLDSNPTLGLRRYKRTERGRVMPIIKRKPQINNRHWVCDADCHFAINQVLIGKDLFIPLVFQPS